MPVSAPPRLPLPSPSASPPGTASLVVTLLGFASGLPLALTGQAMQAWLSMEGLDVATIGFLSLVGLPYTFKFLWAPLMDRFELPWLGRRRGWLVLTQLALAGVLLAAGGHLADRRDARLRAAGGGGGLRLGLAGRGHRRLPHRPAAAAERGLGSSLNVLGYRLAMILSGGVALIWTDPTQGGGWTWPEVYRFMAGADGGGGRALGAGCCRAWPPVARADAAWRATTCSASSPCSPRWRWACC